MSTSIVFVALPAFFQSIHIPYGLLYLATYLNSSSRIQASILDLKGSIEDDSPDEVFFSQAMPLLRERRPDWIGIPCLTANYQFVMEFAGRIKEHLGCNVVVGNVHASLFPEDFIFPGSPVDYAVIGEGEETLRELMEGVESGEDPCKVQGIAYFDPELGFVKTPKRELIQDLDSLPMPDYSLINMEIYLQPTMDLIRCIPMRGMGIYSGRGCPYKCIFCASNTIWNVNEGRPVRFRKPDNVMAEIRHLKEYYRVDGVYFVDDTFTTRQENLLEFCEKAASLNLVWGCNGRANEIKEDMVMAMKSAGCLQIDFGVEAGSDLLLEKIKKGALVKDYTKSFEICRKHGVRAFANMMVNLPGETIDDIQGSVDLMKKIRPSRVVTAVTTPLPGTELYDKYLGHKVKKEEYHLLSLRTDQSYRFKFAAHDSVSWAYQVVSTTIKPLCPDYVRIFSNLRYIKAVLKNNHLLEYFYMSMKRWTKESVNSVFSWMYHTLKGFTITESLAVTIRTKIFRRN